MAKASLLKKAAVVILKKPTAGCLRNECTINKPYAPSDIFCGGREFRSL